MSNNTTIPTTTIPPPAIPEVTLLPPVDPPIPSPHLLSPSRESERRPSIDSGYISRDSDPDWHDNPIETSPLLSPRFARKRKSRHTKESYNNPGDDRNSSIFSRLLSLITCNGSRNWDDDSVRDEGPHRGGEGGKFHKAWSTIKNKLPQSDVLIILWTLFIIEASRGLVISTMYTYVRMLGGTVSTLGICVSLYSVGRLATSVPFGTWADKRSSSREVLIWSSILAVVGNSLYAFAPWALKSFLPGGVVLGVLCASRFAVGCGTGSLSVCKAYLAANSKVEERTKVIAWSGMAQYAGFSITPIIATFLMWLENAYTPSDPTGDGSPTFLACILPGVALAIANALLVPFLYYSMPARDPCTIPSPKSTPERTSVVSYGSTTTLVNEDVSNEGESSPEASPSPPPVTLPPPSLPTPATTTRTKSRKEREEDLIVRWGFILFFFLNFVLRGIIGVTETIAPDMYEHLRSDHENYLEESGRFFFYLGLAGLAVFLLIDPIQKRLIKGDYLLCLGTLAVALGTVLNFDPSPAVTPSSYRRFVAGMVFTWSVGSPICQTLTVSMFSTMLGRRPQGGMIGWITTAGSLGRIAFPALVGVGMRVVNGVDVGMCLVCCVGVLGYRRWVKRVREREQEEERKGLLQ